MKKFAALALLLVGLFALPASAQSYYGIEIRQPVILAIEDNVHITIATAEVTNTSRRPLTFIRAETAAARLTYVHLTTRQGGVRSMHEVPSVQIGVGRTLKMDDNGYHIMLVNTTRPLIHGQTVRINLTFRQDGVERVIPVDFGVRTWDPLTGTHVH